MNIVYEFIDSKGDSTWPQDYELTEVLNVAHVMYFPSVSPHEDDSELTITLRLKDQEI